ncbi:MAG: hypothetical protein FJX62_18255, partial [Alphaproteobacteria bacterium]|nr:hypothetical protein [Alphaproteobacteria bacterium]
RPRGSAPATAAAAGAAGAAAAATAPARVSRSASVAPAEQARQRRGQEPQSQPEPYRPSREPSQLGLAVPLTWPSAYEDVVGFTLWPNSYDRRLRSHGIGNVLAAIFAPSELARSRQASAAQPGAMAALDPCTNASQTVADWPGRQIELAIKTSRTQRAAIDKLRAAVSAATASIRTACRNDTLLTPVARLRSLQNHLWAVQEAAIQLRAPLAEFYDSLSDEQKQQFMVAAQQAASGAAAQMAAANPEQTASTQASAQAKTGANQAAASADPRAAIQAGAGAISPELARMCGMPLSREWPVGQIAQAVRPNAAQQASLEALQKTAFEMGQLLMASCMTPPLPTPIERLDAATDRLTAVIFAASNVALALNDLYGQLSDEQKARFDTLSL